MSGSEPVYNPDLYNKNPLIRETHNCYSYGANTIDPVQLVQCEGKLHCDLRYHQPGAMKNKSGRLMKKSARTCKVVNDLWHDDIPGLKLSGFNDICPVGSSKVALVVAPGDDYHYYRQDADGWWSHKDGMNPVKRYDAKGKPIWNPKTAARDYRPKSYLNYKDFCGFYCVPRNKTIKLSRTKD